MTAGPFILGLLLALGPEQALREAARLDSEGKCGESERYYEQALAKGTPSPALLNNLGNHYLICGQPDKARRWFERLLESNPAHANANLQMARLETEAKHGAKALEYLSRVKDSDPATSLLRAEALLYAGKRAEGLAILDGLGKEAGGNTRMLFALGMTCARAGLYDRAETAFNGVLPAHPDDFDVLLNLGRAAARAQHYDRAQRALEVAARLQPANPDVLLELGLVHAARQDSGRAVFLLAQARQHGQGRPDILLALARAAEDAGYYGDSAAVYDEYLSLRPDDDTVRRDRAYVYARTGKRLEEGLKELAWYIRKHPNDPLGYYDVAQFSWASNPQEALAQLSDALRLDPGFASAYYGRAWLLQRLGRIPESLPDLQAAARLSPGNSRALDQLGLTYLSLDQAAEAEKVLRQALAIAPEDPEVLLHLGRALMALDRDAEAQRVLDQFQRVRPKRVRDPRREAGMIELATLPAAERTRREIERLAQDARTHPSDPELQLGLAGLLLANGRVEEARAAYRELLSRNVDAGVWERAGKSLLAAGQYDLARAFLEPVAAPLDLAIALFFTDGPQKALQAIERVPEARREGDYWLMKARILDAAGRGAEADTILKQALRGTSSRPDVAHQAALLLVGRGRRNEALELLERSVNAHPGNPDLLLAEAVVLGLLERKDEAQGLLKQIESRWPEWDRAYVAHGLLLEGYRPEEARQKFRTARALGWQGPRTGCGLEQVLSTACER